DDTKPNASSARKTSCDMMDLPWPSPERGRLHAFRTARHGSHAGAADLDQPQRLHDGDELVDLRALAGQFEDEVFRGGVGNLGVERLGEPQRLDARTAAAANLDERHFALQRALMPPLARRHG